MERSDIARKVVHIAFGACAVLLKWLTTGGAALMAVGAFVFNLLLLPRLGGKRIARTPLGYDTGILLYPLAVLSLVLVFRRNEAIAGAVWIILAVGDGFATLVGQHLRSPRFPWNRDKSLAGTIAFIVTAIPAAWLIADFLDLRTRGMTTAIVVIATVLVCAIVETLPLHVDDNFTVPLVGGLTMAALANARRLPDAAFAQNELIWLLVNAGLAATGYALRTVTVSGAVGGFALGAALIIFAGWELYVVLLLFFLIGTAATKIGYAEKARRGIAQERGGRRGFSHAFANVGVAAILAILYAAATGDRGVLWLAAVASLATAAADTVASELGPLIGRRTFLPVSLRPVAAGTEGAISAEGTAAGAATAFVVSLVGVLMLALKLARGPFEFGALNWPVIWHAVAVCTVAAVIGSYVESIAGSWNRKRSRQVPNGALNFFNTLVGALVALLIFSVRG